MVGHMKPTITGNMIRAGRALAGIDQRKLAKAADMHIQTLSRMEASGAEPIVSRDSTTVAVLAALGRHGVLMQPRGVALALSAGNANPSLVHCGDTELERLKHAQNGHSGLMS
jgi:hypothetical protein